MDKSLIKVTLEMTQEEYDYVFDAVLHLETVYRYNFTNSLTKAQVEYHSARLERLANKLIGFSENFTYDSELPEKAEVFKGLHVIVDNTKKEAING